MLMFYNVAVGQSFAHVVALSKSDLAPQLFIFALLLLQKRCFLIDIVMRDNLIVSWGFRFHQAAMVASQQERNNIPNLPV